MMMKKLILSMVLALATGVALAQTDFRHISYQEGLEAAKAEGKLLFVDFYTEWCGPCKMMARDVFPQKEVGDYMNAKFVCLKIDAEKDEGVELAERYAVDAYPTFVIIGADEKEVGRLVGSSEAAAFIAEIDRMVDPEKSPERLRERYAGGERTAELVEAYAALLVSEAQAGRRWDTAKTEEAHRVVADYFRGLSDVDRLKEENVFIYTQYAESPSDELTRFLVEHRDAFPEEVQEELAERIAELYEQCIVGWFAGYEPFDAEAYGQAKQDIALLGLNADGHYDVLYRFIECHAAGDLEAYLKLCEKKYKRLSESLKQNLMMGLPTLLDTDDQAVLKRASRFIRNQLKDMDLSLLSFIVMALQPIEEKIKVD